MGLPQIRPGAGESALGRPTFQWNPEGGESSSLGREQQVQRLRGWEELPLPTPQERLGRWGGISEPAPDPAEPVRVSRSWDCSSTQRALMGALSGQVIRPAPLLHRSPSSRWRMEFKGQGRREKGWEPAGLAQGGRGLGKIRFKEDAWCQRHYARHTHTPACPWVRVTWCH